MELLERECACMCVERLWLETGVCVLVSAGERGGAQGTEADAAGRGTAEQSPPAAEENESGICWQSVVKLQCVLEETFCMWSVFDWRKLCELDC